MSKIELGTQQKEAFKLIKEFINSNKTVFTLTGYAGTGKSFLVQYIIEDLEKNWKNYQLCAPTHRAKAVLERFTGRSGMTIHKLLSLSPNLNIMELDMRDLQFTLKGKASFFPERSIIICDEASMVNDYLYDTLLEKCLQVDSKIIFVGDSSQIKPVNSTQISKVFSQESSYTLTEIFRQDLNNPIGDILFEARTTFISTFSDIESPYGNLKCFYNPLDMFKEMIPYFKKAIENKDILEVKLLSYTNDRVKSFNIKIQEIIFGLEKEYYKGQFITAYDNFKSGYYEFFNSMDYIIVEEPEDVLITIKNVGVYPGYKLVVYDEGSNSNLTFEVISKRLSLDDYTYIAKSLDDLRIAAIDAKTRKSRSSGLLWKQYFEAMDSFTTPVDLYYRGRLIRSKSIDYGYAVTLHKSQGGSIGNVFIDMKSISYCRDPQEQRQLQYVGLSRTRNNIFILN